MTYALLVQNLTVGGIQRLVVDEANELARRGHTVWVITFEEDQPNNSMSHLLQIPREHVLYIPYSRLRSANGLLRLVSTFRKIRPDVVLTHHWFANTVGRMASSILGIHSVLSFEHSTYEHYKPRMQLLIDRVLQHACTYVIAVSEAVRSSLRSCGIQDSRIRVVPNGIELRAYEATAGVTSRGADMLFVGRLVRDKGVPILLDALSRIPRVALDVVGDGPERTRLEEQAKQLGITERVRFRGSLDATGELFRKAFVVLVPSLREGFGLVALEALASGTPVIVSRLPALEALVTDGVNGILVPPCDVEALQQALSRYVADDALRASLQAHATQGTERFSIEAHIDAIVSLTSPAV